MPTTKRKASGKKLRWFWCPEKFIHCFSAAPFVTIVYGKIRTVCVTSSCITECHHYAKSWLGKNSLCWRKKNELRRGHCYDLLCGYLTKPGNVLMSCHTTASVFFFHKSRWSFRVSFALICIKFPIFIPRLLPFDWCHWSFLCYL